MYPKNAASPEPIAIGAVVQISDGAVQTSGCTVRIKPIGVAEGDGAGTTSYSTDGIIYYTPTQAETNYTSFILIAKKTSCIPVAVTVVTTSSVTPGTVLLAPTTHTSATIPTVTTTNGVLALATNSIPSAAIQANALNGKGDWNVGKTGYTLAATTGLGTQTGTIGTVTNAVTLPTIPTNWLTADGLATDAVTEIVNAILDTTASGHTTALTLGKALNEWLNASAEPTGAPAANENAIEKLGYLFAALRNQLTVTATSLAFKNDAGGALWSKALSDDGTTYTEAEGT